jgi:hypothetical protein
MAFLIVVPQGRTIEIYGPLQLRLRGDAVPVIGTATVKEKADDDEEGRSPPRAARRGR